MAAYDQVLSGQTSGRRYVPVREPDPHGACVDLGTAGRQCWLREFGV